MKLKFSNMPYFLLYFIEMFNYTKNKIKEVNSLQDIIRPNMSYYCSVNEPFVINWKFREFALNQLETLSSSLSFQSQ